MVSDVTIHLWLLTPEVGNSVFLKEMCHFWNFPKNEEKSYIVELHEGKSC